MLRLKDISKLRSGVLALGIVLAVAIIGLPIAAQYNTQLSQVEVQDDESDSESSEFIASFEAVAPAPIFQDASTIYFVLDEIRMVEELDLTFDFEFIEVFSENLIRVLFNFIIAPNAP